jgi:hypothetical protein
MLTRGAQVACTLIAGLESRPVMMAQPNGRGASIGRAASA